MKIFGKLMPESVKDNAGNVSSTRIQSYHILNIIYAYAVFMLLAEGYFIFKTGSTEVSSPFMITIGGFLTHHLALLGINKNSKSEPLPKMDYNAFDPKKVSDQKRDSEEDFV